MPPTQTAEHSSLTLRLPEGTGTLEFKHETSTQHDITVSHIPPGSRWGPPPHWHQTHHEGFRVVEGFAAMTIGHTTRIYGPRDGDFVIPPYTPHTFKRADCAPGFVDQKALARRDEEAKGWRDAEVVMEEWTVPSDGAKEVFFRTVVSIYQDEMEPAIKNGPGLRHIPALLASVMQVLAFLPYSDTYILMLGSWGIKKDGTVNLLARGVSSTVTTFATVVNFFLGGRLWHKEYIPRRLWPLCVEAMGRP